MKTEHINLAVELRSSVDQLDKVIDEISKTAEAQGTEPYELRLPSGSIMLAIPVAARAMALAALANLQTA